MGDIDDFAVERGSALASGVESLLKRCDRRVESIIGAIIEFAGLSHGLLSNGSHSLRNRGVETELTELGGHVPITFAGLLGGSLGVGGSIHHRASWVTSRAMPRRLAAAEPSSA